MDIYSLSVFDVQRQQDAKFNLQISAYKKILEQIFIRIRHTADTNSDYLVYEIPPFMFGYPPINLEECNKFLSTNLHAKGFKTKKVNPQVLVISWPKVNPKPEQYDIYQNRTLNPGLGMTPGVNFYPAPLPGHPGVPISVNPSRALPTLPSHQMPRSIPSLPPLLTNSIRSRSNDNFGLINPKYENKHQEQYFEAINEIIPKKKNVSFKKNF